VDTEFLAVLGAFGSLRVVAFKNSFNKAAPGRLKHLSLLFNLIFKFGVDGNFTISFLNH
jgi:hypothetical protein